MSKRLTMAAAAPSGTREVPCAVWMFTHKPTGRIDMWAGVVFGQDNFDLREIPSSDWEWREYRLLPVTLNSTTNRQGAER